MWRCVKAKVFVGEREKPPGTVWSCIGSEAIKNRLKIPAQVKVLGLNRALRFALREKRWAE
jgi:hypothetical protein